MDEPIVYYRRKGSPSKVNPFGLYERLDVAFINDDKDEFMRLIKEPGFEQVCEDLYTVHHQLFWNDSSEIVTAVFNGEIKGVFDMEDLFKDGLKPLHLAAFYGAPRLVNYLVQRGDQVDADAVCDHENFELGPATPFDLCASNISNAESFSTFDMLWWLCFHDRKRMEIMRILVRGMQSSKTWARQVFLKYARNGELDKLAALFLAVPELFLSSPKGESSWLSKLDLKLEKNTHLEKQLSLLLDVFALVGHKLAAYVRVEEFDGEMSCTREGYERSRLEIDYFLREVARKKLGVPSPDYYLGFFDVPDEESDSDSDRCNWSDLEFRGLPQWDQCTSELVGSNLFDVVPHFLTREDVHKTEIYRAMASLAHEDAARLTEAIENKLSLLSSLDDCLETIARTSKKTKKWEKHQLLGFPIVSSKRFEPSVGLFHKRAGSANPMFGSFHTSAGSANPMFGVKLTPTKNLKNKVMESTKLKSFLKLSQFPLVAKRLLK